MLNNIDPKVIADIDGRIHRYEDVSFNEYTLYWYTKVNYHRDKDKTEFVHLHRRTLREKYVAFIEEKERREQKSS